MTRVAEAAPVLLTPSSAFALCCDPTWSGGPPADGTARQPQLTVHWGVKFEWDPKKAAENLRKHGISFDEAATAFADWHSITVPDPEHSQGERRYYVLGMSDRGNLLVVCHTDRAEVTPTTSICENAARYAAGTNLVLLSPDVAEVFPDSAAVNEALRTLVRLSEKTIRVRTTRKPKGG